MLRALTAAVAGVRGSVNGGLPRARLRVRYSAVSSSE